MAASRCSQSQVFALRLGVRFQRTRSGCDLTYGSLSLLAVSSLRAASYIISMEFNYESSNNDFSQGSMPRNMLQLAIPMTLAQLINVLYNVVDRMYIGHIPETA